MSSNNSSGSIITSDFGGLVQRTDTDHQSRQEAARLACEKAGIVWPGTILPPGTALYSSGLDTLKSDRAAWQRLPLAAEVVGLVQEALAQEAREDYLANVQRLRLRPLDGRLVQAVNVDSTKSDFGLGYGPHTLRQLVQQVDPLDDAPRGFASALLYLSDQERAEILNKRLAKTAPDTQVTLRTRVPHKGDRIARAALSSKYGSVTDHDIAMAIGEVVKEAQDTAGKLDYKPGDTVSRFEVIWPSEIPVATFVVGDVHYGMLSITNSETGQGSLRIAPAVVRAACANLTLSVGEGTEVVIRHIGSGEALVMRLKAAIRMALEGIQPLLRVVTSSAVIPVNVEGWTPAKLMEGIARKYQLTGGMGVVKTWKDQMEKSQYPETVWGVAAAITESAHQQAVWTDEHEWERVASTVQAKAAQVVLAGGSYSKALENALAVN